MDKFDWRSACPLFSLLTCMKEHLIKPFNTIRIFFVMFWSHAFRWRDVECRLLIVFKESPNNDNYKIPLSWANESPKKRAYCSAWLLVARPKPQAKLNSNSPLDPYETPLAPATPRFPLEAPSKHSVWWSCNSNHFLNSVEGIWSCHLGLTFGEEHIEDLIYNQLSHAPSATSTI